MEFAVANIRDINWKPLPFDDVRIPEEKKKIIRSLTQAFLNRDPDGGFDDFVEGKGRGLNFLLQYVALCGLIFAPLTYHLSGPPGVGKTLTAEAIAESCKIPLYAVGLQFRQPSAPC